jgi:hypothetical protein
MKSKHAELEAKLQKYKQKLAQKKLGYGEVVRTRFGDSYEDQLRDDTNLLESLIIETQQEIANLKSNSK